MKKNLNCLNGLIVSLSMFLSLSAGASMGRGSYSGDSSGPSSSTDVGDSGETVTPQFTTSSVERCDPVSHKDNQIISQGLLRTLMPQGEIQFQRSRTRPKFIIPAHVGVCTDLKVQTAPMGNDFVVIVRNSYPFDKANTGLEELSDEDFNKKTVEELHESCLSKNGFLEDHDGDGRADDINYDKVIESGKMNPSSEVDARGIDISRTNPADSVNLYYASPKASPYGVVFPASSPSTRLRMPCLAYENIGTTSSTRLRTSEKDRRMDEAIKVCESKDPQELIDEIARNYNDGYEDIARILEKVLEDVKAPRLKEIYDRMDEIELALRDDGNEKASLEQSAELIGEYAKLATELEKIQITPALNQMRTLMAERRSGVSRDRREEIDRQLGNLREDLKEFSTRSPSKSNLRFVYENAERYALTDEIAVIESLRISSNYYSKVGSGSGSPSSIRAADEEIERRIAGFNRVTGTWEDHYSLRSGNDYLLRSLDREIKSRISGLNRDIESLDRENQENMRKYCGTNMLGMMNNQVRCTRWRNEYPRIRQRLQAQARDELEYIERLGEKYVSYENIYKDGAETRRDNESDFDDDFEVFGEDPRDRERRREVAGDDATSRERRRYNFGEDDSSQSRDPLTQQVASFPMYPSGQGQQQWTSPGVNPAAGPGQQFPYQQPTMTPFNPGAPNPAAVSFMNHGGFQYNNSYNPTMLQFSGQGPSQMYNGYQGFQQGMPGMQQQGQIFGPTSFQPMSQPGYMQQGQAGRMPAYMSY